jgi:hypothetical protein
MAGGVSILDFRFWILDSPMATKHLFTTKAPSHQEARPNENQEASNRYPGAFLDVFVSWW